MSRTNTYVLTLAQRRKLRRAMGERTLDDVAAASGCTLNYLWMILEGRTRSPGRVGGAMLTRLCRELGLKLTLPSDRVVIE